MMTILFPQLHYENGRSKQTLIIVSSNVLDIKGSMKIPSSLECTLDQERVQIRLVDTHAIVIAWVNKVSMYVVFLLNGTPIFGDVSIWQGLLFRIGAKKTW